VTEHCPTCGHPNTVTVTVKPTVGDPLALDRRIRDLLNRHTALRHQQPPAE
jgi:hypothetical protein